MEKPGSLCWYVTANYRMAKQIAWRQLKTMTPDSMIAKKNENRSVDRIDQRQRDRFARC